MSALSKIIKRIELPREDDTLTHEELYLANYDLLPVPVEKRTWGTMDLWDSCEEWVVMVEAWLAVIFSHVLVAFYMVMTGRPGAVYHIPFPVIVRTSFGQWGSYVPFICRQIMTIVWTGVQSVSTQVLLFLPEISTD
ncbi:permease for cytosine/purines, uracil, thiamine, allantoin-domain-containing protein [Halenospora varia]|nr:permease for cytosine/purines, uracil, thiamine, allantoin-domain-containing protein [Halenospora varia]